MIKRYIFGISTILVFLVPLSIGMGQLVIQNSSDTTAFFNSNEENSIRASINQEETPIPYGITSFDNDSEINLTRTIAVNDWGVITMNDTFNIVVETSFSTFNAYFSSDIIDKIHIQSVNIINSTSEDQKASIESFSPEKGNLTASYTINFAETITNATFTVFYSISDTSYPIYIML